MCSVLGKTVGFDLNLILSLGLVIILGLVQVLVSSRVGHKLYKKQRFIFKLKTWIILRGCFYFYSGTQSAPR